MRTTERCAGTIQPVHLKIKGRKQYDKNNKPIFRYRCVRSANCPVHKEKNARRKLQQEAILTLPLLFESSQQKTETNSPPLTDRHEIRRAVNAGYFEVTGKNLFPEFDQNGGK